MTLDRYSSVLNFESLIQDIILAQTKTYTDPAQFAYRSGRGVDDAILNPVHYKYDRG